MNHLTLFFVIASIWLVFVAVVSSCAVARGDDISSRLVPIVSTAGVFVAGAATLLALVWLR